MQKKRLEVPLLLLVVLLFRKADIFLSSSEKPDDRTFMSSLALKKGEKTKKRV